MPLVLAGREPLAPSGHRRPILTVRGALSYVLSDRAAEKFAKSLAHARWFRVEKAGHNVKGDNPRGLLAAIIDFSLKLGSLN